MKVQKRKQMEILELKNKTSEMKISLDVFNSDRYYRKKRVSEFEDNSIEMIPTE